MRPLRKRPWLVAIKELSLVEWWVAFCYIKRNNKKTCIICWFWNKFIFNLTFRIFYRNWNLNCPRINKNKIFSASRCIPHAQALAENSARTLRFPLSAEFWSYCVLSACTQRRVLPWHQREEIKISNILLPRDGIEPTTCRVYSLPKFLHTYITNNCKNIYLYYPHFELYKLKYYETKHGNSIKCWQLLSKIRSKWFTFIEKLIKLALCSASVLHGSVANYWNL